MSDPLSVRSFGFREWLGRLRKAQIRTSQVFQKTDAALRIRDDYVTEVTRQVTRGQAGGYDSLDPDYASQKGIDRPGRPLLVYDGDLMASISEPRDPNFTFDISARGQEFMLGAKDPKAAFHQKGSGRLPARPLFILDDRITERWGRIVMDEIMQDF